MIYGIIYGILVSLIVYFSALAIMKRRRKSREFSSYNDDLTGIANRRLFDQAIEVEWNRNQRKKIPVSVIIADIDNFKRYNNTYGHTQGDECLKAIARVFDRHLQRAGDLTARYGGEEFIAVLPDTLASEAAFLAEKIRESVETLAIKHEASGTGKILTISLGTCTMVPSSNKNPTDLILQADNTLFQAKSDGRNRVVSVDRS